MSDLEVRIAAAVHQPAAGVTLAWIDRDAGLARLDDGRAGWLVAVEGRGSDWYVTLRGRRVKVRVETWRERVLAEAEVAASSLGGPVDIVATLPGLVVVVAVVDGDRVEAGQSLLTIEAMKMQNEVRAPRGGRVTRIAVTTGTAVATGTPLLRLED